MESEFGARNEKARFISACGGPPYAGTPQGSIYQSQDYQLRPPPLCDVVLSLSMLNLLHRCASRDADGGDLGSLVVWRQGPRQNIPLGKGCQGAQKKKQKYTDAGLWTREVWWSREFWFLRK